MKTHLVRWRAPLRVYNRQQLLTQVSNPVALVFVNFFLTLSMLQTVRATVSVLLILLILLLGHLRSNKA